MCKVQSKADAPSFVGLGGPAPLWRSAVFFINEIPKACFCVLQQEDAIQKEGHVRWGEGFVLVYDITDRGSFEEMLPLKNLLDEVKKPKNVTLILVGNKADLDHSRQVSTEEGEKLATELACAFYECSACTGEGNIMEAFYELCREVRRRKMVQGKTRRRSSTTHVKQAINKMLTKISS